MGIASRAAALWDESGPLSTLPHLPLGSALDLGVVQSLPDAGVVFLMLPPGLEVVPNPLLRGGLGVLSHRDRG